MPHLTNEEALAVLKNRVTARTNPDGTPKLGYKKNVEMLRQEIAHIEAVLATKSS